MCPWFSHGWKLREPAACMTRIANRTPGHGMQRQTYAAARAVAITEPGWVQHYQAVKSGPSDLIAGS